MARSRTRYRIVEPVIVAPKTFKDAQRVIDYDGDVSADLIIEGRRGSAWGVLNNLKKDTCTA